MTPFTSNILSWNYWRIFLAGWIFVFLSFASIAQVQSTWKKTHLNTSNGLSNRFVNTIIQDNRGYTWIGTNFGLNRFDGFRTDILTRESHHLSSNTIYKLYSDVHDQIWVIHRQAADGYIIFIDILDPISFKIRPLSTYVNDSIPFDIKDINYISSDTTGRLFLIMYDNTIYRFSTDGFQKICHFNDTRPPASMVVMGDRIYLHKESRDSVFAYSLEGTYISAFACPSLPSIQNEAIGDSPMRPSDLSIYL